MEVQDPAEAAGLRKLSAQTAAAAQTDMKTRFQVTESRAALGMLPCVCIFHIIF